MERVSRVEPAAVRHAGGERSAQHRFPRGAAGIDKGSAAAPLVPFTAPVIKSATRRLVNGTLPPMPHASPIAGCRMADGAYPAYRLFASILFGQRRYRALIVDQMAHRQYRMPPQHAWPCPAHHLLHLFTLCGLITVHRALLTSRFCLAEDAFIKPLLRVGIEIRVVRRAAHCIRAGALIEGNHLPDGQFFPQDA